MPEDLQPIDLDLSPMSDDDLNAIDSDNAYYDSISDQLDDDPLSDLDSSVEDDTDTDNRGKPIRRVNPFKKVLAKIMDPEVRARAKLVRARAKSILHGDANERYRLKLAAKKLGKLSLAALALKYMMDHHQDEVDKDNEKTLLQIYKASKQQKAQRKVQPASLFALSTLSPKEAGQAISHIGSAINQSGDLVSSLNHNSLNDTANGFKKALINLANAAGFNPTRIYNTFKALFK